MKKILIVDDTVKNIQIIATTLREANYNIAYATSAELAWSKIENVNFDLILIDTILPDTDGFEFCLQLKKNSKTEQIPLLFILPRSNDNNITKAFQYGAADYIAKPFNQDEIKARVSAQVNIAQQRSISTNLAHQIQEKINLDQANSNAIDKEVLLGWIKSLQQ